MSSTLYEFDLVFLAADRNQQAGIDTLLQHRFRNLGIRKLNYKPLLNPYHDCATNQQIVEIMRPFISDAQYALVVMDHEGSGREDKSSSDIEKDIKGALEKNGWTKRAEVIVVEPELEIWVWGDTTRVDEVLDWKGRTPRLRDWLQNEKLWGNSELKPSRPKEALEKALKEVRLPRSSAIYKNLAEKVGFERCTDSSFTRLKTILKNWFS
ncbi:hypothetical protein JXM67_11645 [candidate division WOR-3 bacterium]|nr:hypothetical protein [candidate division WOR-3 bacterium]